MGIVTKVRHFGFFCFKGFKKTHTVSKFFVPTFEVFVPLKDFFMFKVCNLIVRGIFSEGLLFF